MRSSSSRQPRRTSVRRLSSCRGALANCIDAPTREQSRRGTTRSRGTRGSGPRKRTSCSCKSSCADSPPRRRSRGGAGDPSPRSLRDGRSWPWPNTGIPCTGQRVRQLVLGMSASGGDRGAHLYVLPPLLQTDSPYAARKVPSHLPRHRPPHAPVSSRPSRTPKHHLPPPPTPPSPPPHRP